MLPGMGDNRLKCRKPLDIGQSLNYRLAISIQNRLYVHCLCLLWNYRHFGMVAILEYTPFWIGRHIGISAILDPMLYWIYNNIAIKHSV